MAGILLAVLLLAAAPAGSAVLEEGLFQVEYQPGDEALARQSLDILENARQEFAPRLPAGEDPIHVVIAGDMESFRERSGRSSEIEVAGIARSRQGLIVVKAPYLRLPSGRNYAGTLRHELVHVLLHRNVGEDRIPRWFNEGLAMMLANEYACGAPLSVARMYIERRIIPYSHLDFSLMAPGTETEFGDAYAQSLSMTRYLRNELGEETFWALIRDSGPMGFPDALRKHAGKSAVAFWQDYAASLWITALVGIAASGSFFLPMPFLVLFGYYRKQKKNRTILDRWEEEEAEDGTEVFLCWDEFAEDPEAWKGDGTGEEDEP